MQNLAKDIFLETSYEGINVGAVVTNTGIICIDSPSYARDARDWAARLHRLSPYPIQQVILTDAHGDRVLHTRWLNAAIVAQRDAADVLNSYEKRYPQSIIDSLITRNPNRTRELNNGPVERPSMSFSDEILYYKSGHEINLIGAPGPSRGNSWVGLPRAGVLFAGDSLVVGQHPQLRAPVSAEWIANLKKLASLKKYHTIVPGRGDIASLADIEGCIDYLQEMRDQVADILKDQRPIAQLERLVPHFLKRFPTQSLPLEWVKQQIRTSLNHVVDEHVLSS